MNLLSFSRRCDIRNLLSLLSSGLLLTSRLSLTSFTLDALLLPLVFNNLDCRRHVAGFSSLSSLLSFRVAALCVRVRGCDAMLFSLLVRVNEALIDLVALSINDTCSCLVTGLEADLIGKSLDLLLIEDAAMLVAVLNTLLLGDNGKVRWYSWGTLRWW